jgi:hypothetical protein
MINKDPFPHLILRDAWPAAYLDAVLQEFPSEEDPRWGRFGNDKELKMQGGPEMWGSHTRGLYSALSGGAWIRKLESWFGMKDLICDPIGGGYHLIPVGGYLGMHVDFNKANHLGLYRRLNCLIYLNHHWNDPGGELILGQFAPNDDCRLAPGQPCIQPEFNTTVIFETSDHSWHGHPLPTMHRVRKSFAVYYFTRDMPEAYDHEHSTVWLEDQ